MSAIIRTEGRPWIWWVGGGGILVAALIVVGALTLPADDPRAPRPVPNDAGGGGLAIDADGTPLPQADWEVRVFPAAAGKPTKAQKKVVSAQRARIANTVEMVIDALVLDGNVRSLAGTALTTDAARALARSKLMLPEKMKEVSTKRRTAVVGVDEKATHAAAKVKVVFRSTLGMRKVTMVQSSTLWLTRRANAWKVIAFEGTRERRR